MNYIYWITGLPGSGKTTFGNRLHLHLQGSNRPTVHLDGDVLRSCFENHFGYNREDRLVLGRIYLNLAKLLYSQKFDVVVSTVSLHQEIHERIMKAREHIRVKVIFIQASKSLLDLRNQKNLRQMKHRDSPGVTLKVEIPTVVDMYLSGDESSEKQAALISELIANE